MDAGLAEDGDQVVPDRALAQVELACDLPNALAASEAGDDFSLARGQIPNGG
jgi:hypothetical protein